MRGRVKGMKLTIRLQAAILFGLFAEPFSVEDKPYIPRSTIAVAYNFSPIVVRYHSFSLL